MLREWDCAAAMPPAPRGGRAASISVLGLAAAALCAMLAALRRRREAPGAPPPDAAAALQQSGLQPGAGSKDASQRQTDGQYDTSRHYDITTRPPSQ